ncbi:transcription factor TFIIH complex subunit Tfb5-domain-containing protein [Lasiosphaeria miniovina]|uniref:General transcription and DNA repair factor IIH subunit TFB5 n=1 Tax=Lasiosphaeria miniovina TaxID=1954250 RepID=A0AA40E506_9PEZI|nr:transcription factor TFIIH complex subunit Tfb5-domain-containing protein [Lasiosphaeria miniovina]KAK0728434.1 transcription factor TFIIH complex subunit Tfb5-domain-containing protein [Lasiosphaeria miniovina]
MPRATGGILIECEPAIKSIIVHLDSLSGNDFIIEDLDEQHLLVRPNMIHILKAQLDEASLTGFSRSFLDIEFFLWIQALSNLTFLPLFSATQGNIPTRGAAGRQRIGYR